VACSPQAWASGVVFQLVQACLRLSVDADRHRFTVQRPSLPPFLTYLKLVGLELPFGTIDLLFEQHALDVSVTVLRKQGDFEVRTIK
jgi:glycogen debranching enzyme